MCVFLFFFSDAAPTDIYTLSLHDALPIYAHIGSSRQGAPKMSWTPEHRRRYAPAIEHVVRSNAITRLAATIDLDRKSTRLNSSHSQISYAVFCLKKKKRSTTISNLNSTPS